MDHVVRTDLRMSVWAPRDQGPTSRCLSFAITSAHEIVRSYLAPEWMSEESLAMACSKLDGRPYGPTSRSTMERSLRDQGQTQASVWNRNPSLVEQPAENWFRAEMTAIPDVFEAVDSGLPVVVGLRVTDSLLRPDGRGWVLCAGRAHSHGGFHAVCAAGTVTANDGSRGLLVRNSWGSRWGVQGYGLLHETYIDHDAAEFLSITPKLGT